MKKFEASDCGCIIDGACGLDESSLRLIRIAEQYGFSVNVGNAVLEELYNISDEALDYLNDVAVAEGYILEWYEGDCMLSKLDESDGKS